MNASRLAFSEGLSAFFQTKKRLLTALAFVGAALLLYWPTRHAGFVMDWLGWQYAYNRDGWAGVPASFGYPGLHPVLHLGNYALYYFFGANSPVWYVVFAALHGLNVYLLYRLALRLPLPENRRAFVALGTAVLFLFSPYAAEVVVWRVCLHYLLALLFALLAMHRTLDYLQTPRRNAWWQIQAYVALALFSFEWSLVIPLLLLVLVAVYHFSQNSKTPLVPVAARLLAPQAGLWVLYFLINKIRIGDWVGHYGAKTHLNVQPAQMLATMFKYTVKQFGMARHWEHGLKTRIFDGLDAGAPFWAGVGLLALGAGLWLLFFRRGGPQWQWAGAAFAWFFVALLPVSNLYFCYLMLSENDRYGYFATGFGWLGVVLLLSFLPKIASRLLVSVAAVVFLTALLDANRYWALSDRVYDDLVHDFRWYDRDEVILLALPDNYRGVYMFRIVGQPSAFIEALELRRGQKFGGRMWEGAQYNMSQPTDGTKVEVDSGGLLFKTSFRQGGNWWWHNGIGALDYENERYVFRKKEWHVEVQLREKHPNTAVIYPVGNRWEEVK